ncbi:hypothetical protein CSKR_112365 [Clonorchis sinensis]|uniref:Uncharacterized protein n=1 Tax=Clonorchis sinensis TaxID=79923 RepID=A0A3R7DH92_CLOSI|nr:hypothetical protein CSKR_112365 [Clonorchis sinensis]
MIPNKDETVDTISQISRYMYRRNTLLIRLLKILQKPTTGFALLGAHQEEGLRCGVIYLRTPTEQLQTIEQGSKTLICISFTKLNIPLLLERVFLNFLWIFID